jgi:protein O-mannosyl-transferase
VSRASSGAPRVVLLLATVAVVLAYAPALTGDFLFDDHHLLVGQECWRGLDRVPAMLGLGDPNPCTYRPVRYVSYALDWTVASALGDGLATPVYHVSNVVWHVLTMLAVYLLLRRWTSPLAAAVCAALWALHPVQTDSVAYLSGRRDILSTLFFVLAAHLLLARGRPGVVGRWAAGLSRRPGRLALGALCFVLALLAKEMAVTLPAVLVAAVVLGSGDANEASGGARPHLARYWPVYAALLVVAAAFVVWRGVLASHSGMQGRWWGGSPAANFATVFALYGRYLQLIVWPAPLIGDYHPVTIPLAAGFSDPRTLVGLALYAGLVAAVLVAWRRGQPAVALGLAWFLVTMLPVSHLLPHHELFAEHYLYLPLVGLALAMAPLVERARAAPGWRGRGGLLVVAAVLTAMTVRTGVRAAEYRSEESFYEAAHERAPSNARVAHNLGVFYVDRGQCEEALPLLEVAARGTAPHTRRGRDGLAARILCLDELGRRGAMAPLVERLLHHHPRDVYGLAQRARFALDAGRPRDAVADLERAVAAGGGRDRDVVGLLASLYNGLRRHAKALALLAEHKHEDAGICEQRTLALLGLARLPDAFAVVGGCVARYPDAWRFRELRAGLLLAQGRLEEAGQDLRAMRELGAPETAIERTRALWP